MKYLISIFVICLVSSLAADNKYHTFTSADGREMEAKIIRVSGDEVIIERKADGRNFTVGTDMFAQDDQAFIKEWDELKRLSRDDALKITVRRSTESSEKSSSVSTVTERWEAGYTIGVTNETWGPLENLTAHYRIFKFDQAVAAQDRGEGDIERKSGKFPIAMLERDATVEHDTEKFLLTASKLKSNWYYINGGRKKSKDELDGCWVRIYKGTQLVHEYSLPSALMREQHWDAKK